MPHVQRRPACCFNNRGRAVKRQRPLPVSYVVLLLRSSQCKEMSQLVMTRRHEPNSSLNFGFDESCPSLHSLMSFCTAWPEIQNVCQKSRVVMTRPLPTSCISKHGFGFYELDRRTGELDFYKMHIECYSSSDYSYRPMSWHLPLVVLDVGCQLVLAVRQLQK